MRMLNELANMIQRESRVFALVLNICPQVICLLATYRAHKVSKSTHPSWLNFS